MEKGKHHIHHVKESGRQRVQVHVGEKSNTCGCGSAWKWFTIIFLVLFVISVITAGFSKVNLCSSQTSSNAISVDALSKKIYDYVSVASGQNVTILNVSESEYTGLYEVDMVVGNALYKSYSTKDGSLLFASGMDLTVAPSKPSTAAANTASAPTQTFNKTKVPTVLLFTMSYCPYGNVADDAMAPVANLIKNKANIEPHYVIYANYKGGGVDYCIENGQYCSMHGIQELNQDVRELCIFKYEKDKFWKFVLDVNEACTAQNVDACWEAVALNSSIDVEKIKTCQNDEAVALLKTEGELNLKYGVRGSPTLIINDAQFTGARSAQGYLDGVCAAFTTKPIECNTRLGPSSTAQVASGGCG